MTGIDEGERPTCPICGDETYGRPCERSYCAGHRAGYQRGHEAGHEDAGLAAIARASAAYEAGYAACRETMTPAVLATEDAYLLGHEAGRLAAIRAEVERALRDLERDVESSTDWMVFCREQLLTLARSYPRSVLDSRHSTAFRVGVWHLAERRRRRDVGLLAGSRRWLEATR